MFPKLKIYETEEMSLDTILNLGKRIDEVTNIFIVNSKVITAISEDFPRTTDKFFKRLLNFNIQSLVVLTLLKKEIHRWLDEYLKQIPEKECVK